MSKLEFTLWVLVIVGITVLILTPSMGFIVSTANTSAAEIATDPHAAEFGSTIAALKYWPYALYIIPFLWAFKAFWNKLTNKEE